MLIREEKSVTLSKLPSLTGTTSLIPHLWPSGLRRGVTTGKQVPKQQQQQQPQQQQQQHQQHLQHQQQHHQQQQQQHQNGKLVLYLPLPVQPLQQMTPSQTMEIVWHGEFERLFSQYTPNQWFLMPTPTPPSERWRIFKDSAKVRFSCQECGHGWTSMKGRVIFWFNLNYSTNSGWVLFKLYGQQCQKCKNGKYEHAMWYPEEVVKVVGNVYNRVGQIFYGFVRPPLRIDRRQGKPRNQHNTDLCQACKDGLCKEEWSFS